MRGVSYIVALAATVCGVSSQACPDYTDYSAEYHAPFSGGTYNLSYQRPTNSCRTFIVPEVDSLIQNYSTVIKDPDLFRLFENSCAWLKCFWGQ